LPRETYPFLPYLVKKIPFTVYAQIWASFPSLTPLTNTLSPTDGLKRRGMVILGRSIGNTKGATGTPKGTTLGITFLIYTRIKNCFYKIFGQL